ncbi:MAG: sulfatase-like hydrolase/transferase, partial [Planctomycetes bacterium]|nr:sulfatase-like hydrolase/transferase [Planctomycetota bacterium]
MNCRNAIPALHLFVLSTCVAARICTTLEAAQPPNVILVITDDQGYGDLGCHGNTMIRTPHLDRLFQQSVRLTDFHVSPCCTPTRAGLMTGQDPVRVGAWGTTWGRSLPPAEAAMTADVSAAGGYRTGWFAKGRLGDNHPFRPQASGFPDVP